ncbi:Rap1a/Tai family immunity protein [Pseudomonas sp. GL-RE-20]|uniref:Rap1a/Tai family immunity protein n=1 Tax=Pseudomonas sp. GL-RE-20 TaxID=2832372 RepID=UPI001CC02904|nr:Rap1a/Tai family immunity protein [Pseudomonas sp. GL-RE-20]
MDTAFKATWITMFAILSPCSLSAAELAPGVLDAQWLVKNCGSVPQGSTASLPSGIGGAAEAGACIGYLGALVETAPILNRVVPANAQVCAHGQVSPAGLAQVVLDYIKKRPAVAGDPRLVVSLAALSEKYPCR